jgi:hypothetical protein
MQYAICRTTNKVIAKAETYFDCSDKALRVCFGPRPFPPFGVALPYYIASWLPKGIVDDLKEDDHEPV